MYSLTNIQVVKTFDGRTDIVNCIDISKNNLYMISGSNDKSARIWDLKTGKELRKLNVDCWKVTEVAFSDDSKYAVTGCNDGSIKIWEVETGKLLSKIESPGNVVRDITFVKNKNIAVANMLRGSKEYGVRIWPTGIVPQSNKPAVIMTKADSIQSKLNAKKTDSIRVAQLKNDSIMMRGIPSNAKQRPANIPAKK